MAGTKRGLTALFLGASLTLPSSADLRIQVKETFAGGASTRTEYYKGSLWRRDSENSDEYTIVDTANKRSISVSPSRKEYSINSFTRPERVIDESQTIVVEIETRDTGERSEMFGHPARHLITTERRHTEHLQRPPSETREMVTEGWYLDFPLPFPNDNRLGAVAFLTTTDEHGRPRGVPKIQVTRNGPVPKGLAVWEKTGDHLLQVTDFSENPLDEGLFEPPPGFRRVIQPFPGEQLSWADRVLFCWQQLQEWLASLF